MHCCMGSNELPSTGIKRQNKRDGKQTKISYKHKKLNTIVGSERKFIADSIYEPRCSSLQRREHNSHFNLFSKFMADNFTETFNHMWRSVASEEQTLIFASRIQLK